MNEDQPKSLETYARMLLENNPPLSLAMGKARAYAEEYASAAFEESSEEMLEDLARTLIRKAILEDA